jgi:hypothetical protein
MTTISGKDLSPENFEAQVRRLRLRFDGFIGSQRLTYYMQLSFTRGDQEWDANRMPAIVRDAMLYYNFSDKFYVGFGQGKLPGNRQRVISSGNQQFTDRSVVNATFNIDRDFGFMLYFSDNIGKMHYNLKGAITTGEGRNTVQTDKGLAYTGRIELLPLGQFKSDGDFSEGDLEYEVNPKISLAASYSFNNDAIRNSAQRGVFLPEAVDIKTMFIDMIGKYRGWALQAEYAMRSADNTKFLSSPIPGQYVITGNGINIQLSYCFRSFWEIAGRYSSIGHTSELSGFEPKINIYTLGLNRYIYKHRSKAQLNLSYQENTLQGEKSRDFWNIMFQVELGI